MSSKFEEFMLAHERLKKRIHAFRIPIKNKAGELWRHGHSRELGGAAACFHPLTSIDRSSRFRLQAST